MLINNAKSLFIFLIVSSTGSLVDFILTSFILIYFQETPIFARLISIALLWTIMISAKYKIIFKKAIKNKNGFYLVTAAIYVCTTILAITIYQILIEFLPYQLSTKHALAFSISAASGLAAKIILIEICYKINLFGKKILI